MKTRSISPMGALHPALFFVGVYIVALLFSIFICSTIFYSCNTTSTDVSKKEQKASQPEVSSGNTTVATLH